MSDTDKRIERAEKALQKGKPDVALAEYLAILEDDPSNEGIYHTAADVCVSLGRNSEAVKLLGELFGRQCSRSENTRAALTYKKLARITKPTGEQSLTFAHSLARNDEEALKAYEAALNVFTTKGRTREALSALNGIVGLAPSVEHFRRQAELAADLNLNQEAAAAYLAAGELEKDDDSKFLFLERAYKLNSQDPRMAFAYAEALLSRGSAEKAALAVEPFTLQGEMQKEARSIYGRAMLTAKQPARAIRFLWEIFENDPSYLAMVTEAISALAAAEQSAAALDWIRKLEQHEVKAGRRREFISLLKELGTKHAPALEFLEYVAGVFDSANREHDYCETLIKLFDLHYASGNYSKAAECLDRAAEVDAYEPGHTSRLEMLRGKVDAQQFKSVAARLSVVASATQTASVPESSSESESRLFDDLLTQAQIYLRYSMDAKAIEKLKHIQQLFPGEEEKVPELNDLYSKVGLLRRGPGQPDPAEPLVRRPASTHAAQKSNEFSVNDIGRVTEITTNLYRQTTVKNVLFACVNDAGRHWNASRCLAVLSKPGQPPSIAVEYCAPGMKQSDIHSIVKLVGLLQPLTVAHGTLNLSGTKSTKPVLKALRKSIGAMGMQSVLAAPLVSGEDHTGILVLSQSDAPREWSQEDNAVLEAISEQVVLAVANARLRRLVRDLAVTEEKSGLVKRSAYLDVLLPEVSRGLQNNTAVTLMLMRFAGPFGAKDGTNDDSESMMCHIASLVMSHIRQNDITVRYDATTIALILSDTNALSAAQAAEKLRKVAAVTTVPGHDVPPQISVGIAEVMLKQDYEAADLVTELVNRADKCLAQASMLGANKTVTLNATADQKVTRV